MSASHCLDIFQVGLAVVNALNNLDMCLCENADLSMHLLLVTEAQNDFSTTDELLLPAATARHGSNQAVPSK